MRKHSGMGCALVRMKAMLETKTLHQHIVQALKRGNHLAIEMHWKYQLQTYTNQLSILPKDKDQNGDSVLKSEKV